MTSPKPMPSLQALRAFVAVARTGGFTRAAEEIGLTQTAVSHQIAQLEAWVGGALFVRDRSGVSLTPAGRRLLPDVRASLEDIQRALEAARAENSERRLTVSSTPEFAAQWLTPRLPRFSAEHPDIAFSLLIDYRRRAFVPGEIDMAVRLGMGTAGQKSEMVFEDMEFAVCAPDLTRQLPSRGAAAAAPLLRYEGARHTLLDWRRWFQELYGDAADSLPPDAPETRIEFEGGPVFPTFEEMLSACRAGEGFALVRTSLVADDILAERLVPAFVEALPAAVNYHLVYPAGSAERSEIALFRTWLTAEASATGAAIAHSAFGEALSARAGPRT